MDGQGMGASFLPRLEATFLAIFHPVDGPKVLFQMPEDSFLNHDAPLPPQAASQRRPMLDFSSLSDYVIPKAPLCGRLITCEVRSHSTAPHSPRSYKVMGFPVLLQQAEKYQRNNFIFNLCFVFDSRANVSAYEPIVRKCGRSLRLLEEESSFVSRLENLPRLYGIVEQLYEDLNVYYETFIALPELSDDNGMFTAPKPAGENNLTLVDPAELDALIAQASGPLARVRDQAGKCPRGDMLRSLSFETPTRTDSQASLGSDTGEPGAKTESHSRSKRTPHGLGRTVRDAINLKLFPSYPNPPSVHDWDVPVLLLNLDKHVNGSWDLTLVKLLPHINGVNHAKRIAQLADTDLLLVKQCIEHLLYYSFAILIDIFQFSNMYAIRPQAARMLDDEAIGHECAAYVTAPKQTPLPVPQLWRMYSMLRQGRTLYEWADELGDCTQRIDIRRFVTFGIIKGFLRRVHRYPYLVFSDEDRTAEVEAEWPRRNAEVIAPTSAASAAQHAGTASARSAASSWLQFAGATPVLDSATDNESFFSMSAFTRPETSRRAQFAARPSARTSAHRPTVTAMDVASLAYGAAEPMSYREESGWSRSALRSPRGVLPMPVPAELPSLLDGLHSDDELCVRFGMSWGEMNRMLQWIGSPYAAVDVSRMLYEDGAERSTIHTPDLRMSWPTHRTNSGRSYDSGSYFSAIPGRTRPGAHESATSLSSPNAALDPFATREVPSRVKIIAL